MNLSVASIAFFSVLVYFLSTFEKGTNMTSVYKSNGSLNNLSPITVASCCAASITTALVDTRSLPLPEWIGLANTDTYVGF